mmetsp:Transcript_6590/g.19892  ORF Transcript_6590/g.19892 Transcript_6590/m.19892 type:complete len:376 (-) Transcript_6590:409-1536(-)
MVRRCILKGVPVHLPVLQDTLRGTIAAWPERLEADVVEGCVLSFSNQHRDVAHNVLHVEHQPDCIIINDARVRRRVIPAQDQLLDSIEFTKGLVEKVLLGLGRAARGNPKVLRICLHLEAQEPKEAQANEEDGQQEGCKGVCGNPDALLVEPAPEKALHGRKNQRIGLVLHSILYLLMDARPGKRGIGFFGGKKWLLRIRVVVQVPPALLLLLPPGRPGPRERPGYCNHEEGHQKAHIHAAQRVSWEAQRRATRGWRRRRRLWLPARRALRAVAAGATQGVIIAGGQGVVHGRNPARNGRTCAVQRKLDRYRIQERELLALLGQHHVPALAVIRLAQRVHGLHVHRRDLNLLARVPDGLAEAWGHKVVDSVHLWL